MAAQQERPVGCFRAPWRQLFLAAFSLPMFLQTCAAADAHLEYSVKAAFLLNFTKFVEWPQTAFADPQAALEICVSGKNPFGSALEEVVRGEAVNGHTLAVREIGQAPPPATCKVLFVGPDVKDPARLLGSVAHGVLTVGEERALPARWRNDCARHR